MTTRGKLAAVRWSMRLVRSQSQSRDGYIGRTSRSSEVAVVLLVTALASSRPGCTAASGVASTAIVRDCTPRSRPCLRVAEFSVDAVDDN